MEVRQLIVRQSPRIGALLLLVASGILFAYNNYQADKAQATALAPFIDLQEAGLTVTEDGVGLRSWDHTTNQPLDVNIGGTVRFALLYWAGRDVNCAGFNGTTCTFSQPYQDQQVTFNGTPTTGTVIGTETQPVTPAGPVLNIAYFADVTSLVAAAGTEASRLTSMTATAPVIWMNSMALGCMWLTPIRMTLTSTEF